MTLQTLITALAAGLAALYFIRGACRELRGRQPEGACGTCAAGGCPAARSRPTG